MRSLYVLQIGSVYMEQGDLESALSTYMEALEHSPDNPELLTTLGITFLRCACAAPACAAQLAYSLLDGTNCIWCQAA
jgi:Flp pilus assembly protein TadD